MQPRVLLLVAHIAHFHQNGGVCGPVQARQVVAADEAPVLGLGVLHHALAHAFGGLAAELDQLPGAIGGVGHQHLDAVDPRVEGAVGVDADGQLRAGLGGDFAALDIVEAAMGVLAGHDHSGALLFQGLLEAPGNLEVELCLAVAVVGAGGAGGAADDLFGAARGQGHAFQGVPAAVSGVHADDVAVEGVVVHLGGGAALSLNLGAQEGVGGKHLIGTFAALGGRGILPVVGFCDAQQDALAAVEPAPDLIALGAPYAGPLQVHRLVPDRRVEGPGSGEGTGRQDNLGLGEADGQVVVGQGRGDQGAEQQQGDDEGDESTGHPKNSSRGTFFPL